MEKTEKKRPIRVLQIGLTRNIGGLETYLIAQFQHLNRSNVTYDFVNITAEYEIAFKEQILKAGSRIYGVKSRHLNPIRHYWQWIKLLHRIAPKYKAIVLNSNSLTYVFPIFLAKFFGIPLRIMHSHNTGFEQKIGFGKKLLIQFNKCLLKWGATNYFACSKLAGQWMFGHKAKFKVIPNAIDCAQFRYNPIQRGKIRKQLQLENNFVVGHVGRFMYQKNHEMLIQIFYEIYKQNPAARLLLIGDAVGDQSYPEKAKLLVHKLGLEQAVLFLGMRKDVPQLMQAMDCFLLPSRFEGLPVVGIEAQAAGLPCFFSDTITTEVGITNLAYFLSLQNDPKKWADFILDNRQQVRKKTQNCIAQAGYEIDTAAKQIEKWYLEQ